MIFAFLFLYPNKLWSQVGIILDAQCLKPSGLNVLYTGLTVMPPPFPCGYKGSVVLLMHSLENKGELLAKITGTLQGRACCWLAGFALLSAGYGKLLRVNGKSCDERALLHCSEVPVVPTLLVCVACVLSTICPPAPITKDLCWPLPTYHPFWLSYFYHLPLITMKCSCLYPISFAWFSSCTLLCVQSGCVLKHVCICITFTASVV